MGERFSPVAVSASRGSIDPARTQRRWYNPDAAGFSELTWVVEPPDATSPAMTDRVDPHAMLRALPAAAIVVAFDGGIVVANQIADTLFRTPLAGRRIDDLVPDSKPEFHALLRRAFSKTGETRLIGVHGDLSVRRGDRSDVSVDVSLTAIQTPDGGAMLMMFNHTNEQAATVDELARDARMDSLTGLGNRAALLDALSRRFGRPASERPLTVLAIDLEGMRAANQRLDHAAGDDLLKRYATRLCTTVRTADVVARIGGDEFAILCDGSLVAGRAIAKRLSGSAVERRSNPTTGVGLTASIGIAARRGRERSSTLLRRVDAALQAAKAAGRHQVVEAS
jgi:diguanylate cyclase (GGDEF)-like protein